MPRSNGLRITAVLLLVSAIAAPLRADGPVLHEYIPPDPVDDLRMGATTSDGTMPAAIDTPSGVVSAPAAEKRNTPSSQVAYGGNATPDSIDASYRIDRDTTRPDSVRYDDPFIPAVTPFKRVYAYDAVDEQFELVVHDKSLHHLELGGEPRPDEDQFYGDLLVDVAPSLPVRIPSVGPGARVLVARVEPAMKFELLRDGADNWFLMGDARKRVRLVVELAIPRAVFGSDFADVSWAELVRYLPPLPPAAKSSAEDVLRAIGVSQNERPRDALSKLVGYFRSFSPSDETPRSTGGASLYSELAIGKKGVCRHRAYAFVLTALALGIPARLVRNEAHAWVEVFDATRYHRIDLGGAASHMDYEAHSSEHQHRPPPDPYQWPPGSETGSALGDQAASGVSNTPEPSGSVAVAPSALPVPAAPSAVANSAPPVSQESGLPAATVSLTAELHELRRGGHLHVSGSVASEGSACAFARVDVGLRDFTGVEHWLGALSTDDKGHYDGRVAIPFELDVGDYSAVASTPGSGHCGASAK
ncbi:MAG TPA: transglutaminase-like domain-containing protein [Polyangiaceae bacterium]